MESKERQILVTLTTVLITFALYVWYVYSNYISGNDAILNDSSFWGKAFLVLIPVMIVTQIVIHIVFAIVDRIITNEDMLTINDERDKLIELKSIRIAHWIFTFGFLAAMTFLAVGMPIYIMFIALIVSGIVSSVVSELAKLIFYRRGF